MAGMELGRLVEGVTAVRATSKKTEKTQLLANLLKQAGSHRPLFSDEHRIQFRRRDVDEDPRRIFGVALLEGHFAADIHDYSDRI